MLAALPKLEFLVVTDFYADTPLGRLAHIVLPMAMSMEKDGTYTSFDRTVQRLRAAVPPMGEAKDGIDIFSRIARRMGYGMSYRGPARVADEIAKLVPGYGGVTYARLERNGVHVPVTSYIDAGTPLLSPAADGGGQTDTQSRSCRLSRLVHCRNWRSRDVRRSQGVPGHFQAALQPERDHQYPEEKRHMAPRFRGLPSLRADPDTGEALCVACGLCARICPTSCLEMHVIPSEEGDRELGEFILRSGRCMFCGLCSQVCPVDAITMSREYELSVMRSRRPHLHQDRARGHRRPAPELVGRWHR